MNYLHPNTQGALFQLALGITPPWKVADSIFSKEEGRLDIYLTYQHGAQFPCASCKKEFGIYDTVKRTWRHLNFFQYETYLHAYVPRIQCSGCKSTKNVSVPWGRPNSGFTLLFEAFVMELASVMALTALGGIVNEHDTRLMRIIRHYVNQARDQVDMSQVHTLGVDETSKAKGYEYVSTFIDIPQSKVPFVTPGKDHTTVKRFAEDLHTHGGNAKHIEEVCADLSPAYQKGVIKHLPNADIVFDRFHVMKLVNEALDAVRREEQKENPLLQGSRYAWLHNPETATDKQTERLQTLTKLNLKTVRAYRIRLALRSVYEIQDAQTAKVALKQWYFWATHSRIEPVIKVAKTIKKHWDGVVKFFDHRIANGLSEGINSIIQTIKRRARGYQNTDNFITMIYLSCGRLDFNLPPVTGLTHYR